jgi:anti-anti-sigma factor
VVSARLADGEVFDSAKLKNTVRFLIENDMRNVVIDLGNLEYLYSDTINAFIASNRHMLEVSGRIAILTEHPKVQDILKRAGLDNIMRIYRSEAEMIADSKEILRQTSSYRIEELQKISTQPTVAAIPEPAPVPRTEFDDFKAEMGSQLGSKLDNNELPQYQLGVPQNTAPASFAPPQPPSYPSYNQPAYVPPQPAETPTFNGNNNYSSSPAYGLGNNPGFAPSQPSQGFGQPPANFDFPTVQLPINQFSSQSLSPNARRDEPPAQPPEDDTDMADPRQRKPSQERMRSPNARKQQSRRVGGREYAGDEAAERTSYEAPAPIVPQEPASPYTYQTSSQPVLIEEGRSPAKLFFFLLFLVAAALGVYFLVIKKNSQEPKVAIDVPAAPVEVKPAEPVVPTPTAPVEPTATVTPAQPAAPAVPATPAVPAAPVKPPVAETPKPPVKETPARPEPKPKAVVAHAAPKKPAKAVTPQPAPVEEEPAAAPVSGKGLHITSSPSGAEVLINFSKKGTTPLDVSLLNNSNKIIVRLPGYKRFETTLPKNYPDRELNVELDREGGSVAETRPSEPPPPREPDIMPPPESRQPEVARQPERQDPPPRSRPTPAAEPVSTPPGDGPIGIIFLSSSPARADILIDGKDSGKKTPAKLELPSGQHHIEMVRSGQRASVDQLVNEGKNKALHLTLQ